MWLKFIGSSPATHGDAAGNVLTVGARGETHEVPDEFGKLLVIAAPASFEVVPADIPEKPPATSPRGGIIVPN